VPREALEVLDNAGPVAERCAGGIRAECLPPLEHQFYRELCAWPLQEIVPEAHRVAYG